MKFVSGAQHDQKGDLAVQGVSGECTIAEMHRQKTWDCTLHTQGTEQMEVTQQHTN